MARGSAALLSAVVTAASALILQGVLSVDAALPSPSQLSAVSSQLQGQLIPVQQQDFAYADTLQNYLRRGDDIEYAASQPGLYLVAESEADVVAGIKLALDSQLKTAFHGSGHHQAALSLYPGGITIDVSNLKDADINPDTHIARLQMGLYGLEVANLTEPYNLHYRIGHASSVGIAGFTLGAGAGWGGLAIDRVTGFDVVNTWEYPAQELTIKRVDATHYPDLFFALQGAGGMVGAVVAIYYELQPLPADGLIRSPVAIWPLARSAEAVQGWNSYIANSTSDPYVEIALVYDTVPGAGPSVLWSVYDWTPASNDHAQADDFITGLLNLAKADDVPVMDAEVPYLEAVQSLSPPEQYPNVTHYAASAVIPLEDLPEVTEILNAGYANATSPLSTIIVDYPSANDQKSNNDTAYGWRGNAVVYVWAFWTRTAGGAPVDGDAAHVAWVKGIASQLDQYSLGHYINFVDFEEPEDTQKSFPAANWAKVKAAKAKYDPLNLFRELDFFHNKGGYGPLDAGSDSAVQAAAGGR